MATAQPTTDHDVVRTWVEERGGYPARVRGTGSRNDPGILRIDFPGFSGEDTLEEIEWDEFFEWFDRDNLALMLSDEAGNRFNKLVSRSAARAGGATSGAPSRKRASTKSSLRPSARKVSTKKSSAKKSSTKKASTKKASTKASSTKKTSTKKASAKRSSVKKASAKRTSGAKTSTRKPSTAKAAGARKSASSTKKASTKKSAAKRTATKRTASPKKSSTKRGGARKKSGVVARVIRAVTGSKKSSAKKGGTKKAGARAGASVTTTNRDEIRKWVEARGGFPAHVKRTGKRRNDPGVLRIDYPGYSGTGTLERIGWDDWFDAFEANELAFVYQKNKPNSRFSKLVAR